MSLAQRVREFRYSKGWGPDELASRAEISRTALYQIESGKTELPRAGTLRRIALALGISIEALLGQGAGRESGGHALPPDLNRRRARESTEWYPTEGAPLTLPPSRPGTTTEDHAGSRFAVENQMRVAPTTEWLNSARERELTGKLHRLLESPLAEGVARILEDAYRLLSYTRSSG
jgi:transcriptional regulator with XRE-family HTH domain